MVKNPQANAILEQHQVLSQMLGIAELDMAESVTPNDVNVFCDNGAWAFHSNYHRVLKASPGAVLNLGLSLKSMKRILTNYGTVCLSNG
jgi:hypothetical protein